MEGGYYVLGLVMMTLRRRMLWSTIRRGLVVWPGEQLCRMKRLILFDCPLQVWGGLIQQNVAE
eukprot:scaffold92962_cov51-Attheya_sp.AAC.1